MKSILGSLCLVITIISTGCNKSENAAASQQQQAGQMKGIPVQVVSAHSQTVPVYLDQIGRIAAVESVDLRPRVGGLVLESHFTEGSFVRKGDVLFVIDPKPFEVDLARAEAALLQSQESLRLAEKEFNRIESLKGTNVVSEQEYDSRKITVATSSAQVKVSAAAMEAAKLNVQYCSVVSPINGRTGQRMIDPGNMVKASETSLVSIQNLDSVYIDFTIPEKDLPGLRQKMKSRDIEVQVMVPELDSPTNMKVPTTQGASPSANVSLSGTQPVEAQSASTQPASTAPSDARKVHIGKLVFVDNEVKAGSGTIKLRAMIPNTDRELWPGQFATVRIILDQIQNAVLVPQGAVQIGPNGPYVFVVNGVNIAEMHLLQLGQRHGKDVVALSGLQGGDQVVSSGHFMLQPNMPVMILPNNPPQGPMPGK